MMRSRSKTLAEARTVVGVALFLICALTLLFTGSARAQSTDYAMFAGRWIQGRLALQAAPDGSAHLVGSDAAGHSYTADLQFQTVYNVAGAAIAAGRVTHDYQLPPTLSGATIYFGLYPQSSGLGFLSIDSGNWLTMCASSAPPQFFGTTC